MRRGIELAVLAGVVVLSGCATKKYVAQQVDPVQQKLNQVDQAQQSTQKQLDAAEPKISAAQEKADAADAKANEASGQATAVGKKTDQLSSDLSSTRNEFTEKNREPGQLQIRGRRDGVVQVQLVQADR